MTKNEKELRNSALIMVFQHQAEELRFIKSLQWKIINYVILLQIAVVTANKMISDKINTCHAPCCLCNIIFIILILLITCKGIQYFYKNLDNIKRKRNVLIDIIKNKKKLGILLHDLQPTHKEEEKWKEDKLIKGAVISVIVIGAVVSIGLIILI